jgi:hypothetical protein
MRYHRSAAVLASVAVLSVIAPVAHANPPAGAGAGKVIPFVSAGGVNADEVLAEAFKPGYTGEEVPACNLLAHGKILAAQPDSDCTIKPGTQVLVPLPAVSCSDAEPSPFFATTAAGQRACALGFLREGVHQVVVSVDGGPAQDVFSDRFLNMTAPQFRVVSQPDNPNGATPGPTTVVAVAYQGVLRGLPPGHHTFVVSGVAFGPFSNRWAFTIVPGADH